MYFFYYIPIGLDVSIKRRRAITYFLAVVIVILFFIYRYRAMSPWWNVANLIFLPLKPSFPASITYAFLHTGYFHVIGNVVYLLVFGRALEDRFGPGRFSIIFVLSAIAGAYTHFACAMLFSPEYMGYGVIGASGAASGLMGAFLVRFHYSRIRVAYWIFMPLQGVNRAAEVHLPGACAIIFWVILQVVQAILQFGVGGLRVAYGVHVGGFAAGVLLAILFGAPAAARAERRLVKARRSFERADWFAAQGEYINYLAMLPHDAEVHAEAARAFRCSSDMVRVRHHYRESIERFLEGSERHRAEEIFVEAMRTIPGFALEEGLHLDLAFCMERTMKYVSAYSAYGNFVGMYPKSCDAPLVLLRMAGMLERRFRKPLEALSYYRRLVDKYPEDIWVDFAKSEIERLASSSIAIS